MPEQKQPFVSVNGVPGAMISPLDRGFAYGDGVFETLRVQGGCAPLWPLHEQRLTAGAHHLGIGFSPSTLRRYRDELLAEVARHQVLDGVLKLVLSAGVGGRGYQRPPELSPTVCLLFYPGIVPLGCPTSQGFAVSLCQQRLADSPALAGIKHLNRLEQVLARRERAGYEWPGYVDTDGLLLDQSGAIIEATASNLFIVSDGQLMTPDLSRAGVAGVARRLIIERLAPANGLMVKELSLSVPALKAAQEVFLCNSVKGIWPVTLLDLKPDTDEAVRLPSGPITRKLQTAFNHQLECGLV